MSINGDVVSESYNAITNDGMAIIRSYLANPTFNWAGAISIGSMNKTAAAATNTSMDYEIAKIPVVLRSVQNNEIIIKGVLNSNFSGRIYELGIYSEATNVSSNGFDDSLIVNFDELWLKTSDNTEVSSGSFTSTSRVGDRNLIVGTAAMDVYSAAGINLNGYSSLDSISLLFNVNTIDPVDRVVRVTFVDSQLPTPGTKYADFTIDTSFSGYDKLTTLLGNFTETGNFNGDVTRIRITASSYAGAGLVHLDAIRINDEDEVNPNFALVSRSLIGTQNGNATSDYVVKPSGVEVDIEYRVELI
jgi:hypothetical protein